MHRDSCLPGGSRHNHSSDHGHTVHQHKPNNKAWAEWRRCLHLNCNRDASHTLKVPLGAWTVHSKDYTRQWVLLYSPQEDAIYHHTAFDYSVHRRLRHNYDKDTVEFCDKLPQDAVPIEYRETTHTWIRPSIVTTQDLIVDDEPQASLQAHI